MGLNVGLYCVCFCYVAVVAHVIPKDTMIIFLCRVVYKGSWPPNAQENKTKKKNKKLFFMAQSQKKFPSTTLSTLSFNQAVFPQAIYAISTVLRLLVSCYFWKCPVLQTFFEFVCLQGVNFALHQFGLFPASPC